MAIELVIFDVVPTISIDRFEWDSDKSATNEAKHGISFNAAVAVWESRWLIQKNNALWPSESSETNIGVWFTRYALAATE